MLFDMFILPTHAIFPLGVAIVYIALGLFVLSSRKPDSSMERLLLTYLFLTTLWNVNLVFVADAIRTPVPGMVWSRISAYGLIILGAIYWAFARAFLQKTTKIIWPGLIGLVSLGLAISFDLYLIELPPDVLAWSMGWVYPANLGFIVCITGWTSLMSLAGFEALIQQFRIKSPAHKNRIRYLFMSVVLLMVGYSLYLVLGEPYWATGLIITGLGGALTAYTIVVENLIDLGTGVRRLIGGLVVALVTITVYVAGIYLVQIFLGDLLTSSILGYVDHTLIIATVTAVLLTIVYTPIREISQRITDRILFGQHYDYQTVIQSYTQMISNRLYLEELAFVAMKHIHQALRLRKTALFILDGQSDSMITFRTLPGLQTNGTPLGFTLKKGTPVTQRLLVEGQPLAQYTVDISTQFRPLPADDRQTLKKLNYEWFVPIRKEEQLVGMFALGSKKSRRPYTTQDLNLLATLADQTGLALENARLFDRVQRNLAEMTEMKNLMNNVFDSMDDGVITTDIGGNITFHNKAASTILMTPLERCLGTPYIQALPSLARTIFPNLVRNVTTRESHYPDYEIISEFPGRGRVNLNVSLAPLKDAHNRTQGVTIVMDDLTETKRLQAVGDMFRRYVSPAVVDRLPSDPGDLQLGGQRQEVTILFADIRGFTTFSEKLAPEELVDTLNQYLSMAARSILAYEGTLDKFMGDAVMGIFNAPLEQEDHVLRAVRAAAAMQQAIEDYHKKIREERHLSFGVGLHVGEVVVGNVGMSDRMDYTAIGDAVNVAKRIQENCPGGKILLSKSVYEVVKDSVDALFYKELQLKGREEPMEAFELRRFKS